MAGSPTTFFSDANRAQLAYVEETEWGVLPTASPAQGRHIPFTSSDLEIAKDQLTSAAITPNRGVQDQIDSGETATGSFAFEFSATNYDPFLRSVLFSEEGRNCNIGSSDSQVSGVGITPGTPTNTASVNLGTLTAGQTEAYNRVRVGDTLRIRSTGTAAAADNNIGIVRVTAKTDAAPYTLTVERVGDTAFTTETGRTIYITGTQYQDANTRCPFSFLELYADKNRGVQYTGCYLSALNLTAADDSIITGSFEVMGRRGQLISSLPTAASRPWGANNLQPAHDTTIMSGASSIHSIQAGENSATKSLTLNVNQNLRVQKALGSLFAQGVGLGQSDITINFEQYFEDFGYYENFVNNVETSFYWVLQEGDGPAYAIYIPRIKISECSIQNQGVNTDIMVNGTGRALQSEILNDSQIRISVV